MFKKKTLNSIKVTKMISYIKAKIFTIKLSLIVLNHLLVLLTQKHTHATFHLLLKKKNEEKLEV